MEFLDSLDEHDVLTDALAVSSEEEKCLQSLDEETPLDPMVSALHKQGHEHVANCMRLTKESSQAEQHSCIGSLLQHMLPRHTLNS